MLMNIVERLMCRLVHDARGSGAVDMSASDAADFGASGVALDSGAGRDRRLF